MTDEIYRERYLLLEKCVHENGELDGELMYEIYEGKIKAIVINAYKSFGTKIDGVEYEDLFHDIFIILWEKSLEKYFLNPAYEKTGAVEYLKWCKIVASNYIKTVAKKKANRVVREELDNEEKPFTIAGTPFTALDELIYKEDVRYIYNLVSSLHSKIEMKLVWYGVFNRVYSGFSENKIKATHDFINSCSDKSLKEVYGECLQMFASDKYSWAKVSALGLSSMESALDKVLDDGTRSGDRIMGELLGDNPAGKISDWIYKITVKLEEIIAKEDIL